MISKKLLSEVLPDKTIESSDIVGNMLWFNHADDTSMVFKWNDMCINIYELAHKCKEWADMKGVCLDSRYSGKCILRRALHSTNKIFKNDIDRLEVFTSNTEPEAIFKACEWILDDRR